jgi:hypothetical protein
VAPAQEHLQLAQQFVMAMTLVRQELKLRLPVHQFWT